jgi:hypothetical protein
MEASLKPDLASGEWDNIVVNALYTLPDRDIGNKHAKFALFFPNGGKIGQCERILEDTRCSGLSFPGADAFIRSAFAALDEFVRGRDGPEAGEFVFGQAESGYRFTPAHGRPAFSVLITRYLTTKEYRF